jgi:hypothetical protein
VIIQSLNRRVDTMNNLNSLLGNTNTNTNSVDPMPAPMPIIGASAAQENSGEVTFFDYDSAQQYPAPDGKRLVTCTYRNKAGTSAELVRSNQACFVPNWINGEMVEENKAQLLPFLISFLQDKEAAMIKDSHKAFSTMLGASKFTSASLLEYLEASQPAGRLNSVDINTWFMETMMTPLVDIYIDKVGEAKVVAVVEFINKKLQALASPKTYWNDTEKEKLIPILEAAAADGTDPMATRLLARVVAMDAKETVDLLDSL